MLTIEKLRAFGADVDDGLSRCLGREDFYLRLVGMAIQGDKLKPLGDALAEGDPEASFEAAHALKGVYANLSLTPLLKPAVELTENLRRRVVMDYGPLYEELVRQDQALRALAQD